VGGVVENSDAIVSHRATFIPGHLIYRQLKYTNIPFVSFGPIVSGNIHMGPVEYITIFRAPIPSDQCHKSSQARGLFKKARCLTRPARARQDVPFLGQGRRGFSARSVHGVREGARREERQACAPQRLQQRPENAAGGLFHQAHMRTLMIQGRDSMEGD